MVGRRATPPACPGVMRAGRSGYPAGRARPVTNEMVVALLIAAVPVDGAVVWIAGAAGRTRRSDPATTATTFGAGCPGVGHAHGHASGHDGSSSEPQQRTVCDSRHTVLQLNSRHATFG